MDNQQDPYGQGPPRYRLSEYDKKRLDEMRGANLPAFWIGYVIVIVGGLWVLDWLGL